MEYCSPISSYINKEEHVADIDYLITLEGYVHWKLTGEKVLEIGDCSRDVPCGC